MNLFVHVNIDYLIDWVINTVSKIQCYIFFTLGKFMGIPKAELLVR